MKPLESSVRGFVLDWKPLLLDTKPLESSVGGVVLD